ncbi:MAG: class F sortase [Ktedonobacteraceae bacterium]
MRKVIGFLCVLAIALLVVQNMHLQVQPPSPYRLIISSIGVDTDVETVGVLQDGNLATPSLNPWDDVGWYAAGPRPGEMGSAVIDGHLDRPGGSPAVFWNLRDLHVGDSVMIMDTVGDTVRFRVTRIALYHPQQAPVYKIFGNKKGSYLNLITCAGDWIASQHQTTFRLVVYTTLVR